MAVSNIKAVFHCDVKKVWDTVTLLHNYAWRSDVGKIEIKDENVNMYLRKQQKQYISDLQKALVTLSN